MTDTMNTAVDKFEEWYGNNDLIYSNDVKSMAFKAWKTSLQALLSQGEPVAWTDEYFTRVINNTFKATGIFDELNKPLYEVPPLTEALQKDKEELIEYAENIRGALDAIMIFGADIDKAKEFSKMALAIPQPKCMQE